MVKFANTLEEQTVKSVENGIMTKDLALIKYGKEMKREHYVTT